jgi:DNA repair protein RecO (recombination protein O)
MIFKTRALVLHKIPHTDHKMIVGMFTELGGYESFLCQAGARQKPYFPMSIVEITAERKSKSHWGYVKEIRMLEHVNRLRFDVRKSVICMFLHEILYKILHNKAEDEALFCFLFRSVLFLCKEPYVADFHLRFLSALMQRLGFCPTLNYSVINNYFNVETSSFEPRRHLSAVEQQENECLYELFNGDLSSVKRTGIVSQPVRNKVLEKILQYYTCHICNMGGLESYSVLKELT